ncbi:hypothetical protein LSH36_43g02054 [Paralvinella palmiformis]|uniref:Beclin 1-associated autophagy-related key regulator n=1 Tax=Paralvinella palmiformis TaxID=53620 RepID=A0AAD9ND92_9ANNE|nr:hypothetical protein LSH36_43g02054 [Paralvinella palmiformis]
MISGHQLIPSYCLQPGVQLWRQDVFSAAIEEEESRNIVEVKLQTVVHQQMKLKEKITAIANTRQHFELLSKAITEASAQQNKGRELLGSRRKFNESVTTRLNQLSDRRKRISDHITKLQTTIDNKRKDLADSNQQLCVLRQQHVHQLTEHVFTITQIQTQSEVESSYYVSELSEARHTAYIKGRWVYTDAGSEPRYRIIYPTLPGDADYVSYMNWVSDSSMDSASVYPVTGDNQLAYNVEAALTYTAQLVALLAYFLDVNMTQKISYGSLHRHTQTKIRFNRFVSRLNQNILQLCFSQNVPVSRLNAKDPVHNLLALLQTQSLGSSQPSDIDCDRIQHLESQIVRDPSRQEDESSEEESTMAAGCNEPAYEQDWERVPMSGDVEIDSEISQCDSVLVQPGSASKAGDLNTTMPSVVGAIMSSAAASVSSIWRAATWKK